jgi:serine/threonine protein kinase
MSPELFDPETFGLKDSRPTKESDYYALGMVIYEVLSGKVTIRHAYEPEIAVDKVLKGKRPYVLKRPQGEGRRTVHRRDMG